MLTPRPGRLRTKQNDPSRSDQPRRAHPDVQALLAAPPETVMARCRGPRYWPTWLFVLWLRLTALLPWRFALSVHKALGSAAGKLAGRRRRIVRRNLEICFPDVGAEERERIVGRHFANLGAFFAELAAAWFGSAERRGPSFKYEGIEHLQAALAAGRGVLLYTGHFTSMERCAPRVKELVPLYAFMFRPRRNPLLNALQTRGRERYAHAAVANDDVRQMLDLLRRNAVVWYSPDQARIDSGELVKFFGEPAMTSTAPSRLARLSGAAVVPLFYRRLPDDSGYLLRFHRSPTDLPSRDPVRDTARLTAVLEGFIRECPEQYFWTHRKFKDTPGTPDAYDRPT